MERQSKILDGLPSPKAPEQVINQTNRSQGLLANPPTEELTDVGKERMIKDLKFDTMCNSKKHVAFTLTFREILRLHWKEQELSQLVNNTLKGWKYLYYDKLEWMLLPDIDSSGNFHYHGCIRIRRDLMPKFKRNMTKKLGFIKMKYIDNPSKWYAYCFKEGEFIAHNVYSHPQILDKMVCI